MSKAHEIRDAKMSGTTLTMVVDGRQCRFDLARTSKRLARATQAQRDKFELSPSGYGIHWPELDEDLTIDGLLGIVHAPATEAAPTAADRPRS
ncbi:DUF2442 domain-containing protein [candidate division WOR-3 bacterium]|nr:DUF2442 domain-containing protein [candidate division WOR-3 bacterium]